MATGALETNALIHRLCFHLRCGPCRKSEGVDGRGNLVPKSLLNNAPSEKTVQRPLIGGGAAPDGDATMPSPHAPEAPATQDEHPPPHRNLERRRGRWRVYLAGRRVVSSTWNPIADRPGGAPACRDRPPACIATVGSHGCRRADRCGGDPALEGGLAVSPSASTPLLARAALTRPHAPRSKGIAVDRPALPRHGRIDTPHRSTGRSELSSRVLGGNAGSGFQRPRPPVGPLCGAPSDRCAHALRTQALAPHRGRRLAYDRFDDRHAYSLGASARDRVRAR